MADVVRRRRQPCKGLYNVMVGAELVGYETHNGVFSPMAYRWHRDAQRSLRYIKTIWPQAKVVKG